MRVGTIYLPPQTTPAGADLQSVSVQSSFLFPTPADFYQPRLNKQTGPQAVLLFTKLQKVDKRVPQT